MILRSRKNILIVDDHPIVRQGIRSLLEQEPDLRITGEAESAGRALTVLRGGTVDAAIIDISLKGTDGLELTKSVRAEFPHLPILILSMHDESMYAERALRSGANGYLMKQEVADNIVTALRSVLQGRIFVSAGVRETLLSRLAGQPITLDQSPIEKLSDRELEVFRMIGQGLGTREIAAHLHLSIKTIETYRSHIKEKLHIANAIDLVRQAVHLEEHGKLHPMDPS
jgi:DNA-binding NarL/FixJ family response regulator